MNTIEQRDEIRYSLFQKPKGMLFLHVRGECLPVRSIRDISQTGISLLFDYDVSKGDHVDIEYKDRNNEVKVTGIVVWCNQPVSNTTEENAPKHLLGISMFNPNLLLSFIQVN